ncbi:hypothetical protein QTP88_006308 [Uroleucon formosanum]
MVTGLDRERAFTRLLHYQQRKRLLPVHIENSSSSNRFGQTINKPSSRARSGPRPCARILCTRRNCVSSKTTLAVWGLYRRSSFRNPKCAVATFRKWLFLFAIWRIHTGGTIRPLS